VAAVSAFAGKFYDVGRVNNAKAADRPKTGAADGALGTEQAGGSPMNAASGRKLKSMFVMQGDVLEYVAAGSAFRRLRTDDMTETARIDAVYTDATGIPHVRYDVVFEKPNGDPRHEGPRNLALSAFIENFSQRV
jgi:hypothetical protein